VFECFVGDFLECVFGEDEFDVVVGEEVLVLFDECVFWFC